jgi:type IV pilus assembly protein PilB
MGANPVEQQPKSINQEPKRPKRIGDLLIEAGIITQEKLEAALTESRATGDPIGVVLIRQGHVSDRQLGQMLAVQHNTAYFNVTEHNFDKEVLEILPEEFIRRNKVIPISIDKKKNRITVVMSRPDDLEVLDEISLLTGLRPVPMVSTHKELDEILQQFFTVKQSAAEAMAHLSADIDKGDIYDTDTIADQMAEELQADDKPVVKLVNSLLIEAIETGASDVHMEPQKERLLIRYRIDGILREAMSIPKKMAAAVVSRVKIVSGMDIAEKRRPQDGRMKISIGRSEFDMRVNTMAVMYGEKVCIRILRPTATAGGFEKLGFGEDEIRKINKMIRAPHGVCLVTGPTGSGKTTTLYSCLREINTPEKNIVTIEDPVEYPLAGINQTQVSTKAGLTFAMCLRAILRQDPDIIMVGEIRDNETLEAAIHAALTGHLVFSTLHTNSAGATITRMLEMGTPAYLLSSAIIGVMAQRLVRRTCPKCKRPYKASKEEIQLLRVRPGPQGITLYKGKGCDRCGGTGYEGRLGLYEIMNFDREIQTLIDRKASSFQITETAVKNGMLTLAMDGRRKALAGLTTITELQRILGIDLEG